MMYQAVTRLTERSGLTEAEALKRVKSQISNEERVSRGNVVLCTLWHPEVTQKQVGNTTQLLTSFTFHLSCSCALYCTTISKETPVSFCSRGAHLPSLSLVPSSHKYTVPAIHDHCGQYGTKLYCLMTDGTYLFWVLGQCRNYDLRTGRPENRSPKGKVRR